MKIEVQLDENCTETKVIVVAANMSEEVQNLLRKLSAEESGVLSGFRGDRLEIVPEDKIFSVYSEQGKVRAKTEKGEYLLRLRMYELEERLDKKYFVRISNAEIVNLRKVRSFDLSFSGTICISFIDGTTSYVSRRYVGKIKKVLGV